MSGRPSRANRRDANEPEIVEVWQRAGCVLIQLQPGQGADWIVIAQNGMHVVEIKDPAHYWKLTDDELKLKAKMEYIGRKYHIITTPEEAAKMVTR